ncbi:MBL fold metallo-hydrolase [Bifidobacterium sp.]|jgi:mRNA degradation ribonuclease J1/J2|uniref:MBL fold metallo-hydrolase n=1 Tax=Bifidobacterium sp. TaxID=41200 RepID=UPI0025BC04B6|nr:MBL fold metallo-hydrolase [Bifidobacterium sp.]MCH4208644.1 MBL fold metallo-hydrolase [Bifidobacterium sp.]MCI1224384.1 MBL fold metallo-hydrolase [Bifidobacterium sp.]
MASKDSETSVSASGRPLRTRITFYRGIRTIGGNLIDVEYGDSHILFDFGTVYKPAEPQQPSNLPDLVDLGYVPYIEGIFDRDIPVPGHDWHPDPHAHAAVFISHAHLDHSKMINYIDRDIPLYASVQTKAVLEAMNTTDDFDYPPYAIERGEGGPHTRPIEGVAWGHSVQVGQIKVTVLQVDHDAYGASGFRIETPDKAIAYTGDIRFHGFLADRSRAFLSANAGADALIMEGTSLSFRKPGGCGNDDKPTETSVCEDIAQLVASNPDRQITFNYYLTNIERIGHLIDAIDRTTVLSDYAAYVFSAVTGRPVHYYRSECDCTCGELDPEYEISLADLIHDDHQYFWQLDDAVRGAHLDDLARGGLYIHTGATPLGPYDPSYAPFFQAFADHGIETEAISCTGHAYVDAAFSIIDAIKPHVLFPVHGEHPERYFNQYGSMVLPEPGLVVEL